MACEVTAEQRATMKKERDEARTALYARASRMPEQAMELMPSRIAMQLTDVKPGSAAELLQASERSMRSVHDRLAKCVALLRSSRRMTSTIAQASRRRKRARVDRRCAHARA